MHVQNWDDLRFVAVLARHGSLSQASQLLGVDRSTVQRRIRALEARLGYRLFVKTGSEYAALAEAEPILAAARSIEAAINGPQLAAEAPDAGVSGTLSVTTTDSIYLGGLSDMIDAFQAKHPGLRIDLLITTRKLTLGQLEADVAIRPSDNPPDHFVGRRVCDLGFNLYATEAYLGKNPGKRRSDHSWLTVNDTMAASVPGRWAEANVPPDRRALTADTFVGLAEACLHGRGIAMLPACYASQFPDLVPVPQLLEAPVSTGLWLLTHSDLKDLPRVRVFIDHMWKQLSRRKKHFSG